MKQFQHTVEPFEFRRYNGSLVEVTQAHIDEALKFLHSKQLSGKYRDIRTQTGEEVTLDIPTWSALRKLRRQFWEHEWNNPQLVPGQEYLCIDNIPVPLSAMKAKDELKRISAEYHAERDKLSGSQRYALSTYKGPKG